MLTPEATSPDEELKRALGLLPEPQLPMLAKRPVAGPPDQPPLDQPPIVPTPQVGGSAPISAAPVASAGGPMAAAPARTPLIGHEQTTTDQSELERLKNTGSGIHQIHNPVLHGLAKFADILGTAVLPGITSQIPGTELHHRVLMNQQQGAVNQDLANEKEQAGTEETQARTEQAGAETGKLKKETELLGEPKAGNPEEQAFEGYLKQGLSPMDAYRKVKEDASKPQTADSPLGERGAQLNKMLADRYQVLHPGAALPPEFTLPANATEKHYQDIDKALEATERASGTKAQQEEANQMRQAMLAIAQQNAQSRQDSAQEKKDEKAAGPRTALEYATNYLNSNSYSGPGDEALMEKFFELAKPSSGFRMTEAQQKMLFNAQSWMDSLSAKARHATMGTYFSTEQRKEIVKTMNDLGSANANIKAAGTKPQQSGGAEQPIYATNPKTKERVMSNDGGKTWQPAK